MLDYQRVDFEYSLRVLSPPHDEVHVELFQDDLDEGATQVVYLGEQPQEDEPLGKAAAVLNRGEKGHREGEEDRSPHGEVEGPTLEGVVHCVEDPRV